MAILARFFFGVALTRTRVLSLTLALVGAGLAIGPLGGGGSWVGIGLGLLSALIYSFYILAATRVTRDVDALSCGCRGSRRPTGLARSDRAGVCCSAGPVNVS